MENNVEQEQCEICGSLVARFNTVYLSSEDKLTCACLTCYNKTISDFTGADFEDVEFEPIIIKDLDGKDHKFHFTVRLLGDRVAMDAFEIKNGHPGGSEFGILGDIEDELFGLFGKLFERMRRALSRKHIYKDEATQSWQITNDDVVRGQLDCDLDSSDDERRPLLVIDGKDISWNQVGRMLMTYEGFNFKLEIFDKSEEMP